MNHPQISFDCPDNYTSCMRVKPVKWQNFYIKSHTARESSQKLFMRLKQGSIALYYNSLDCVSLIETLAMAIALHRFANCRSHLHLSLL